MEKQGKEVKFKSVILSLAARKLEGERGGTQSLRCNLQAEMSPGNSQEISSTFPGGPRSAPENSGAFQEGAEQPPEAASNGVVWDFA